MEEFTGKDDMILLFDSYGIYSEELYSSFRAAGYSCPAVVIEDDGFLPDELISVYGFFLGNFAESKNNPGRPRYFNEIKVPNYWEISGNNRSGKVQDLYRERGRIFYTTPLNKRLVKAVDWLDERGIVRSSDHYNRYGALYARTAFDAKGQRVTKSWFSPEGREVIVENYVTGDIILKEGDALHFFRTKTEFVLHFLAVAGFWQSRLFYNSLSTPFFVSQSMTSPQKRDILFWQEPVANTIPGNMQIILKGHATRTEQIMVQMQQPYDRLIELGADKNMVHRLGFIYNFEGANRHRQKALICTNSDRIEHLEELVSALPGIEFHVAALTEMSAKLMGMGKYSNVRLYPGVKIKILEELFDECDFYLDINHESEIVSAVRRAFLHNQLILAFRETLHNGDYVAKNHIFSAIEYQQMGETLKRLVENETELELALKEQRGTALAETSAEYARF